MEKFETKFTPGDVKKIKYKRRISNIAYFLAFIIFTILILFKNDSYGIFLEIFFYTGFGITLIVVLYILLGNNSNKDLTEKVKIIAKVKVSRKRIQTNSDSSRDDDEGAKLYMLDLKGNDDINTYHVNANIFKKISVGDIIQLEYSKNSLLILKAVWNNIDLEDNNFV